MNIYIVDKNEQLFKKLKEFFSDFNLTLKTFIKVSEFQKYFLYKKPDIVVCNPLLPGMSQFLIVKWIREQDNNIPIIIYVENPTKEIIILAKKYKVNSMLIYPFQNEELLLRVKKLLKVNLDFKITNPQTKESEKLIKKEKMKNQILVQIDKLPSFPTIIREIENLLNRDDSNAKDFEEVIKKDQVITAKVLKLVNSPFYSLSRKFTTISESVAYIGHEALRSIVYSASVSNILKGSFEAYGYKKDILWKHSYTTAFIARIISEHINFNDKIKEELFVSGLIHDIGKIILGLLAKKEKIKFFDNNQLDNVIEIEKKYFYFSHCDVGEFIADKWRLPDIHKSNILNHHTPTNINNAIIYLSDLISKFLLGFYNDDEKIAEDFKRFLKIEKEQFEKIKEDIFALHEKIEKEGIF